MTVSLSRALFAEGLGTFGLVFLGLGAAVVQAQTGALGPLGVPAVFGLTVAVLIAVLAPVSGAHLNPAATLALTLAGPFPGRRVLPYVAAQLLGAAAASFLLRALFGTGAEVGVTVPTGNAGQALVLEVTLTFFLLLAALRSGRPWVVGATVTLEAAMGGPVSGASMNPARSFGPALASGVWTAHWVYWAAPLLGAVLAVLADRVLRPARGGTGPARPAQEFSPEAGA